MAHKINLALDLKDRLEDWSDKKIWVHWLEAAVTKRHQELAVSDMKIFLSALKKMDEAETEVEFSDSEFEFFREAFLKAKFPPANAAVVSLFYEKFGI